jgi:hypothetical protein
MQLVPQRASGYRRRHKTDPGLQMHAFIGTGCKSERLENGVRPFQDGLQWACITDVDTKTQLQKLKPAYNLLGLDENSCLFTMPDFQLLIHLVLAARHQPD